MIRSEGVYDKATTYTILYRILKGKIKKDYGPLCRDFVWGCSVCQKYLMLSFLQECVDDQQEVMWDEVVKKK